MTLYIDLLDTIHCYLIHSVDMGFRINNKNNVWEAEHNDDEENTDWLKLMSSKTRIVSTEAIIENQVNQQKSQKFCSNMSMKETKEDNAPINFSFGHRHYYWNEYKHNDEKEKKEKEQ
eukprot:340102_1